MQDMFEHLLSADEADYVPPVTPTPLEGFKPVEKTDVAQEIDAKLATARFMEAITGSDAQITEEADRAAAQAAFTTLTAGMPEIRQRDALAEVKTPEAVKHLVGMLSAYDWAFVEQAKEIRGYIVAQLTEESKHPDARIRLKALQMLGNVTEIGLFTERVEVKHTSMTDEEIDRQIEERLGKLIGTGTTVDNPPQTEEPPK